jgi:hypothetical protein
VKQTVAASWEAISEAIDINADCRIIVTDAGDALIQVVESALPAVASRLL